MFEYYDYVLSLVPVSFGGVAAVLAASGVGRLEAMAIGATAACLVVGHALFVNGPVVASDDSRSVQSSADCAPTSAD